MKKTGLAYNIGDISVIKCDRCWKLHAKITGKGTSFVTVLFFEQRQASVIHVFQTMVILKICNQLIESKFRILIQMRYVISTLNDQDI